MANCPAAVPRRRTLLVGAAALACPGVPLFAQPAADTGANMAALVVVIEAGADRVALVDGARLALLHRFPTRPGLLAAPSFWPGGRFVLLASADGWLSKFDLVQRRLVAEVRAGSRLAGVAISSDGRWVMAANTEPPSAPLFDADLNPVKTFAATTRDGRRSSAVDGVHDAPARRSFIVALRDIAELWEISYNPRAEDFYEGLVHDFRMGEGVPTRGFHNARRTFLPAPLTGLYIDPPAIHALGNSAGAEGAASSHAVNLDVRRRVASLVVAGHPQLAGAVAFEAGGRALLAVPNASRAVVSVFDRADWRLLHELPTAGPGLRLAAHPLSPFICVATAGVAADASALTIIDQRSLQA
ncbi:MAG: cytochrome D1 domain-containing protein, partial [Alphaproteobacteria bacterium]|nr:cytochrome D1 domain-containing protein [Alphaproteobacteria bacterium]